MNKSDSIKELAGALAKAQGELKNPGLDGKNPHFKSKYATLAAVRDAITPTLSKHGLSLTQLPVFEDGKAGCETLLMHDSGEYVASVLMLPVDKPNAHGVGSALTYARRYALMAIAGVVGDEDDDGNAAVGEKKPILAATITPTEGAWDRVPAARHEMLNRIGSTIIDHFAAGDEGGAYACYISSNLDAEEKIAVWTLLDSKQRAALKRMQKEQTTLVGAA